MDCSARKSVVAVSVVAPELAVICEPGSVLGELAEARDVEDGALSAMLAAAATIVEG